MEPSCVCYTYVICTNNNLVNYLLYHLVAYFTKVHEIKRCSLVHVYLTWFPFNMPFNFGVTLFWILSSPFHIGETTKIGQLIYSNCLLFNLLTFIWFIFMSFLLYKHQHNLLITFHIWISLGFKKPQVHLWWVNFHSTHNTFRIVIKWNQN